MADTSIRPVTIAEQAQEAARRFVETGEAQPNPHDGTAREYAWRCAFQRYLQQLQASEGSEGGA